MKLFILVAIGVLVLWSLWGILSSRVEQAAFTVVSKTRDYELRRYAAHIEAQTTVTGAHMDAMREGFTIIAGYIFGGNTSKASIPMTAPVGSADASSEKIAMTAPVVSTKTVSEKVPMTAPVVATGEGERQTISFVMPRSYTLETLPTPNDARVALVAVPERTVAAHTYYGYTTQKRTENMKALLLAALARDGVEIIGTPAYAGYNAPGTPPWLVRHEILVEVK
jgi:hypothetical protein